MGMEEFSERDVNVYHCKDVFWQPTNIVCNVDDHASENRSPAPVSKYGHMTYIGSKVVVDQTYGNSKPPQAAGRAERGVRG